MTLLIKISDYFAHRRDVKWARRVIRNYEDNLLESYKQGQRAKLNTPTEVETAYLVLNIENILRNS